MESFFHGNENPYRICIMNWTCSNRFILITGIDLVCDSLLKSKFKRGIDGFSAPSRPFSIEKYDREIDFTNKSINLNIVTPNG